jgi:3-hydroxybutyryl-CoA dehydratase
MNHYSFEEIKIGVQEHFETQITEEKMKMFTLISGDYNPMHIDHQYAKNHGFSDKIVYGMLASSLYSTLVGMYLPGEKCLLNKCNVDFRKPVYVGDKLLIEGKVVDKREGTRRIRIKAKMINQEGIVVNVAEITVSFTSEKNSYE